MLNTSLPSFMVRLLLTLFVIPAAFLFTTCSAVVTSRSSSSSAPEALGNKIYVPNVKSIVIGVPGKPFDDVALLGQERLQISFDLLGTDLKGNTIDADQALYARIIHCNANWKKSVLNELEYLYDYNEFPLNQYDFSFNTKIPYTHYTFTLPRVKVSGNYILEVYTSNERKQVLFSKRFMMARKRIPIDAELVIATGASERRQNHQIDFTLNYGGLNISNPTAQIKIVLRQNQQWFNAIKGLRPSFIREDQQELEYRAMDLSNNFPAFNEYRFFDLRFTNTTGQNVEQINTDTAPISAKLLRDRSRYRQAYASFNDMNGNFVVGNRETGGVLDADYINTFFSISSEKLDGEVYVTGNFFPGNNQPGFRLTYDSTQQVYRGDYLLKQGFYNYLYYVKSDVIPAFSLEGSHMEAENRYEVMVYTRSIEDNVDRLLGYTTLNSVQGRR